MKVAISNFFDDMEKYGDKQTKEVLKNKLSEIIGETYEHGGVYQQQNLQYIKGLDMQTKKINQSKKKSE